MERKVFWISFTVLGSLVGLILPLVWSLILTIPIMIFCWWLAFRCDWFEPNL